MLENNQFFINKVKNVVFIGAIKILNELVSINKKLGLKSIIITSPHQAEEINVDLNLFNLKINMFNKLDNDFKNFINNNINIDQTLFLSLGSRWIFNKDLIEFFKFNLINYHLARLPLDAGGGQFSWKIMREDRIDNQLFHLIDENIDTGPILSYDSFIYPSNCKIPIEFDKFRLEKFIGFYEKFIDSLINLQRFTLKPQLEYLGRYQPRLNTKFNGWVNWNISSYHLIRFINAFDDPFSGASTMINNYKRVFIKKAHLHGGDSSNHPYMSGLISRHDNKWLVVSTTDENMLIIEEVLDENNNNIISLLKAGDRFFTPHEKIDLSKNSIVEYSAKGVNIKKF